MQVDAALRWEIKVDDYVDSLNIDSSGDQIRTDQSLVLSISKPIKAFDSLIWFHVGV